MGALVEREEEREGEREDEVARDVRLRVLSRTEPLLLYLAMPATVLFAVRELLAGRRDVVPFGVLQAIAAIGILVARRRGLFVRGLVITLYAVCFATLGALVFGPLLGVGVIYTLAIVASAGLVGRRAVLPTVSFVLVSYLTVAALSLSHLTPPPRTGAIDFATSTPWVRIGLTLGIGATIAGLMTSYIIRSLEDALQKTRKALARERIEREERERAQEALARAQRLEAVGQLAAGVAHDLNNALGVVVCSAESLREGMPDDGTREQLLVDLLDAARSAEETTRQLTMLGRKDAGPQEHCRPSAVIEQLARSLHRLLPPNITIVVVTETTRSVPLSRSRLEQVLLNLALNARDAMPNGGTLRLETRDAGADDELVRLLVADDGVGISEEVRARLFEPFFTTKEAGRGSGLGLSMVHAMITGAGGTVDVGGALGEGTTFTLTLPGSDAAPSSVAPAPVSVRLQKSRNARVLVVEDEPSMLRAIARVLRGAGFEVVTATDGAEADDELATKKSFDLLLTDAILPGTDTLALIDRFLAAWPESPVMVCSGYVKEELVRQGIAAGRFRFLQKPFRPNEIVKAVEEALRKKR